MECMKCFQDFDNLCSAENVWERCCWDCFQDYLNHYEHDNIVKFRFQGENCIDEFAIDVTKCVDAIIIVSEH